MSSSRDERSESSGSMTTRLPDRAGSFRFFFNSVVMDSVLAFGAPERRTLWAEALFYRDAL